MSETIQQNTPAKRGRKPKSSKIRKNDQLGHSEKEILKISDIRRGLAGIKEDRLEQVETLLRKYGKALEDDAILSEARAEKMRRLRENAYGDVKSLLEKYRKYRRLHQMYVDELTEKSREDSRFEKKKVGFQNSDLFEKLADRLELMDVAENARFRRSYQPYIETGIRIEKAMGALHNAISDLQSEVEYNLITKYYIEGDSRPSVQAMKKMLDCSVNKFYSLRDDAIKELTLRMFGIPGRDPDREIRDILSYLHASERNSAADMVMMDYIES